MSLVDFARFFPKLYPYPAAPHSIFLLILTKYEIQIPIKNSFLTNNIWNWNTIIVKRKIDCFEIPRASGSQLRNNLHFSFSLLLFGFGNPIILILPSITTDFRAIYHFLSNLFFEFLENIFLFDLISNLPENEASKFAQRWWAEGGIVNFWIHGWSDNRDHQKHPSEEIGSISCRFRLNIQAKIKREENKDRHDIHFNFGYCSNVVKISRVSVIA